MWVFAAAAALAAALLGVGTADAGDTALLLPIEVEEDRACDSGQNDDQNDVDHNYFAVFLSALSWLLVRMIRPTMKAVMARTAARPATAAPMFSSAPVISVPMV